MNDTKWREIRRDLADPNKNPFRSGTPLYQLFEESKAAPRLPRAASRPADESSNPFEDKWEPVDAYAELEKKLQAVGRRAMDADGLVSMLQKDLDVTLEDNAKLKAKVDILYGAVTALSNLLSATMDERLKK